MTIFAKGETGISEYIPGNRTTREAPCLANSFFSSRVAPLHLIGEKMRLPHYSEPCALHQ